MSTILHNMMQYLSQDLNPITLRHPAEHLQSYNDYFQEVEQEAVQLVTFSQQQQVKYRVRFMEKFAGHPQAVLSWVERGGSVAVFDVIQGPFKLELRMLMIDTVAPRMAEIGGGTFGKICEVEGRKGSVSKRFRLRKRQKLLQLDQLNRNSFILTHSPQDIKQAVLECSLAKICSMLDIGPQFHFIMGFDLILFDDCIQFYMQKCRHYNERPDNFPAISTSLKKRVRAMHMMHLTHKDIKPPNVLYSPNKKQLVLCDFGISDFVPQKVGWKSLTLKEGTKEFMSEEMKQIMGHRPGWVDMYWNDVYALKKTMAMIQGSKVSIKVDDVPENDEDEDESDLQKISNACYKLYCGNRLPQLPSPNPYTPSLSQYFPQLLALPPHLPPQPLNPILLASYADPSIQLPYFLQLCDLTNIIAKNLSHQIEFSPMSRMDLRYFKDINETFENKIQEVCKRRVRTLERELEIFEKIQPRYPEAVENWADVVFQILKIAVTVPTRGEYCGRLLGKLEDIYQDNQHLPNLGKVVNNAYILFSTMFKFIPAQMFKQFLEKKIVSQPVLLRTCQIILKRQNFSQNDFNIIQILLSYVKKSYLYASYILGQAYQALGDIQKAIEFYTQKLKQNNYPKASFLRLKSAVSLSDCLIKYDPLKAYEFCSQELKVTPAKFRKHLEYMMVDIYSKLGRIDQSNRLLEEMIERERVTESDASYFLNLLWVKQGLNFQLIGESQKSLKVLGKVHNFYEVEKYDSIAFCYLDMGRYWESIRLYERLIARQYNVLGFRPIQYKMGIVAALSEQALSRNDEYRLPHLHHALSKAYQLFQQIKTLNFNYPKKCLQSLSCLRLTLKITQILQMTEAVTATVDKLKFVISNTLEKRDFQLAICVNEILDILQFYYERTAMSQIVEICLEKLKQKQSERIIAEIRQNIAVCYLYLNQPQKSKQVFQPIFQNQIQIYSFLSTAIAFYKHKQYNYAIRIINFGLTPNRIQAPFWRGMCYYGLNDRVNCELNILEYLITSEEKFKGKYQINCFLVLSSLYKKFNGFMKTDQLEQTKNIGRNFNILCDCGLYFLRTRRFSKALPWLNKAFFLNKAKGLQEPWLFVNLAVVNTELKKNKKALYFYKRLFHLIQKLTFQQLVQLTKFCSNSKSYRFLYRVISSHQNPKQFLNSLCIIMRENKIHFKVLHQALKYLKDLTDSGQLAQDGSVKTRYQPKYTKKYLLTEAMTLKKLKLNCLRLKRMTGKLLNNVDVRLENIQEELKNYEHK